MRVCYNKVNLKANAEKCRFFPLRESVVGVNGWGGSGLPTPTAAGRKCPDAEVR